MAAMIPLSSGTNVVTKDIDLDLGLFQGITGPQRSLFPVGQLSGSQGGSVQEKVPCGIVDPDTVITPG